MMMDDPFSGETMSEGEIADCVEALLRTYGNEAGAFLIRELEGASNSSARSNWTSIASRYADLVERTADAHRSTLMEIEARVKAAGVTLN